MASAGAYVSVSLLHRILHVNYMCTELLVRLIITLRDKCERSKVCHRRINTQNVISDKLFFLLFHCFA